MLLLCVKNYDSPTNHSQNHPSLVMPPFIFPEIKHLMFAGKLNYNYPQICSLKWEANPEKAYYITEVSQRATSQAAQNGRLQRQLDSYNILYLPFGYSEWPFPKRSHTKTAYVCHFSHHVQTITCPWIKFYLWHAIVLYEAKLFLFSQSNTTFYTIKYKTSGSKFTCFDMYCKPSSDLIYT